MKKVTMKQDPEKEVPLEVIASSIVAISDGIKKLRATRLNERALFLLIQYAAPNVGGRYKNTQISITEIRAVFEGIESLESTFLKKKESK